MGLYINRKECRRTRYWPNLDSVRAQARTESRGSLKKAQFNLVTGRGGLYGSEMPRIPHYLDNQLTNDSEVVSLTRRPRSTLQKHSFLLLVLISVRG
jgi:hypothetical protein